MGLPAIREYYEFIEGHSIDLNQHNKMGPFAWLALAVCNMFVWNIFFLELMNTEAFTRVKPTLADTLCMVCGILSVMCSGNTGSGHKCHSHARQICSIITTIMSWLIVDWLVTTLDVWPKLCFWFVIPQTSIIELLICLKFGQGVPDFHTPFPRYVVVAWSAAGIALGSTVALWSLSYYLYVKKKQKNL